MPIQKIEKPVLVTGSQLIHGVSPSGYTYSNKEGMIKNELFNIISGVLEDKIQSCTNSTLDRIAQGFKDAKDLYLFIKNSLGLVIPHKRNCNNTDHCAPFEYVSDAVLGKVYDMIIIGNRGGAKSFNAGLIQWLLAIMYPMYEGKILGGSADQSMKSYEAMLFFWTKAGQDSWSILDGGEPRRAFTKWKTGSSISILTASQKSVRGPHPNTLGLDEVDEMKPDILEAALQQPMTKNGIPSRMIALSTYHKVSGTMARLLGDTAVDDGDENILKNTFLDSVKLYKYCHDKETEVLTNNGWKLFKNVLDTDTIFSLNPKTNTPEYINFKKRIEYKYEGNLIHFKSFRDDIMVTPNHRMYTKTQQYGKYNLIPAEEVIKEKHIGFSRYTEWKGDRRKTINIGKLKLDFKLFCEFMGYYISEGCLRKSKGIKIAQSKTKNPKQYLKIKKCLEKLIPNKKICCYDLHMDVYNIPDIHIYLKQFGDSFEKFIPIEIKEADKECINIFLDAYLLGDGYTQKIKLNKEFANTSKVTEVRNYYTSSLRLSSDVGELIIKKGRFPSYTKRISKANKDYWVVRETISKASYFKGKNTKNRNITTVPYNDFVYCLELEKNHVMLTRRNGRCTWQGNCVWEILEPCVDYRCSTCVLSFICPGEHMKKAVGYYKINDFVKKLGMISKAALESEWLCTRPSRKGLILEVYDESINTVDVGYIPGLPVDISIDFGFSEGHEFAVEVFQEVEDLQLPDGRVITGSILVDEIYMIPETNGEVIELVKKRPWGKYPGQVVGICDSAAKDLKNEWNAAGFKIKGVKKPPGSVIGGINTLTSVIKPVMGPPKFYANRKCKGFQTEKDNYKYGVNGEPIKKHDNAIDAVRYRFMSRSKSRKVGGALVV